MPQDRDFIKNTFQADGDVLAVATSAGEFVASFSKSEQMCEHGLLAYILCAKN